MRSRDTDKQQRIKESMVKLILEEGMSGASVAKIAKAAGVSPATIYVYYENKEEMLAEVYKEYAQESYHYLQQMIRPEMDGAEFIDAIVRGYYAYSTEHMEQFSFVEQCSRCPTLQEIVCVEDCCCGIYHTLHEFQRRGVIREYSDVNMTAVLFAPVKFLAMKRSTPEESRAQLDELVQMMQVLLLM